MSVAASHRFARISAQKVRLVIRQIVNLPIDRAIDILTFSPKKAAKLVKNVLNSAIANAEHNEGADIDELKIVSAYVNEASKFKRMRARARGRGNRILKPTCHITIVVDES